jgi:hypothetical protein
LVDSAVFEIPLGFDPDDNPKADDPKADDPNIVELPKLSKLSKRPELRKFPVRDPAEGVRSIKAVRGSWCSMKIRQGRLGKIVIVVLFGQLQQQSGLSSTFFPG